MIHRSKVGKSKQVLRLKTERKTVPGGGREAARHKRAVDRKLAELLGRKHVK